MSSHEVATRFGGWKGLILNLEWNERIGEERIGEEMETHFMN